MSADDLQKLKAAAKACHGWSWPDRRRDENGTHHFGKRTEDGEFYNVGTIDCWTYTSEYADDLRVLKFLRLAQPAKIEALIAEAEAMGSELAASRALLREVHNQLSQSEFGVTADRIRSYLDACNTLGGE